MKIPLIYGHHRSGNHYLAALINVNFFQKPDYLHLVHSRQHVLIRGIVDNRVYLYIHRNFVDVSRSVFNMRARLGLDVASYEDFLKHRYCDMYTGKLPVSMKTNFMAGYGTSRSNSIFFSRIKATPEEWHTRHVEHFRQVFEGKPNCLMVDYDELRGNLQVEMAKIAVLIRSKKTRFDNVIEKVGWWPS